VALARPHELLEEGRDRLAVEGYQGPPIGMGQPQEVLVRRSYVVAASISSGNAFA
jgi:hypothetical protein